MRYKLSHFLTLFYDIILFIFFENLKDEFKIQDNGSIKVGQRVLIIDDVISTGGGEN